MIELITIVFARFFRDAIAFFLETKKSGTLLFMVLDHFMVFSRASISRFGFLTDRGIIRQDILVFLSMILSLAFDLNIVDIVTISFQLRAGRALIPQGSVIVSTVS